jgi:hypothetical protein
MAYFPDAGEPGYQFVFFANGSKDADGHQLLRTLAIQIVESFRFK